MSDAPGPICISTDVADITLAAFDDVYGSVGFHRDPVESIPDDYLDKMFGSGTFGIFAFQNDALVGVAQILSDDYMCAYVAELCVHKSSQGNGVGSALMKAVNDRFSDTAL